MSFSAKNFFPEFPNTPHLPYHAVLSIGDTTTEDIDDIFTNDNIIIEEKIDGANIGFLLYEGNPIVRNREHILQKGYLKDTPAKMQFRPAWNYFYEHKDNFEKLNKIFGGPMGIYGEWVLALHGVKYNKLPSYFIAFDLYDPLAKIFVATPHAREVLQDCGFVLPPLLHKGKIPSIEYLDELCNQKSAFGDDLLEGIYIKIFDKTKVVKRMKMIRKGYIQGQNWSHEKIVKQGLAENLIKNDIM